MVKKPAADPKEPKAGGFWNAVLNLIQRVAEIVERLIQAVIPEIGRLRSPGLTAACSIAWRAFAVLFYAGVLLAVLALCLVASGSRDGLTSLAAPFWGLFAVWAVCLLAAVGIPVTDHLLPGATAPPRGTFCTPQRYLAQQDVVAAQLRLSSMLGRLESLIHYSKTLADKDGIAGQVLEELKNCNNNVTRAAGALGAIGSTVGVCHLYDHP